MDFETLQRRLVPLLMASAAAVAALATSTQARATPPQSATVAIEVVVETRSNR